MSTDAIVVLKNDHKEIRKTLQDIGAEMQALRTKAPKRPSQPSALKKVIDAVVA